MLPVDVHPLTSVTVTEYAVVDAGLTLIFWVVSRLLQVYVYGAAPPLGLAVRVADPPTQISVMSAVTVTDGLPSTVTVTLDSSVHPFTSETVTVYVVLETGVTSVDAVVAPVLPFVMSKELRHHLQKRLLSSFHRRRHSGLPRHWPLAGHAL